MAAVPLEITITGTVLFQNTGVAVPEVAVSVLNVS